MNNARREGLKLALGAGVAALSAAGARAEGEKPQRVVYHLADADKVPFVLGNLRNHLDGTKGRTVTLACVVHGPALANMAAAHANPLNAGDVKRLTANGVAFHACAHTMDAMKLTLADLLPGFARAENGGVVLLADLQADGWAYLRP
jgi:uncharacterized protein